nr:CoA transferase [Corynebacterium lactis]
MWETKPFDSSGDASGTPGGHMSGLTDSLRGIRVVNFALNLPGPLAAQQLGQLGAEVVKVEPPAGDPFALYASGWYEAMSAGHSVQKLDLKSAAGRAAAEALLEDADIAITSFRPSALERMGLGHLDQRFEGLIHIDIVGDVDSPETPGHDLTYQAEAGTLTPPAMPPVLLGDILGAEHAVTAALAALVRERVGGVGKRTERTLRAKQAKRGTHVRIGLKQAGQTGALPREHGLTSLDGLLGGGQWTYGIYAAADGYVAVAALEPHFAEGLMRATGSRDANALAAFLGTRSTDQIMELARRENLPIAPVRGD